MMTEWTSCSRTCGRGSQSRQVACTLQLANGTLVKAKDRDCAGPKPAPTQRCEGQDCLTVWEAGVWSEVRPHTLSCDALLTQFILHQRKYVFKCIYSMNIVFQCDFTHVHFTQVKVVTMCPSVIYG